MPVAFGSREGILQVNIVDAVAPLLIGVDVLSRLGAVIDCSKPSIRFAGQETEVPLVKLRSGHLAMSICRAAATASE